MSDERYWIAINGASCALTAFPMRHPFVIPTPEQLLGFPTLDEARKAQQVCLNAPMPEVKRFMQSLSADVMAGRVRVIKPKSIQSRRQVDRPRGWKSTIPHPDKCPHLTSALTAGIARCCQVSRFNHSRAIREAAGEWEAKDGG